MTRNNRKTVAAIIAALGALLFITGCSSDTSTSTSAPQSVAASTPQEAPVEEKPSLNGTWTAEGFVAEISDNNIQIDLVSTDSKALYWKGTFPVGESDKIVSKADVEALSMSLMGSSETEKTFVVADENEITFSMSMMGVESTIHLKR